MGLTVGQRLWLGWGAIVAVMAATYVYILQSGHGEDEALNGAAATTESRRAAIAAMQEASSAIWQSAQSYLSSGDRQASSALADAQTRFEQALGRYRDTAANPGSKALANEVHKRSNALNARIGEALDAADARRERRAAFERYLGEGRTLSAGPPQSPSSGSGGRAARRQAAARELAKQVQERLREALARTNEAALRSGLLRSQFHAALARYEVFADTRPQREWLQRVQRWIGEADRQTAALAAGEQAQQRSWAEARRQHDDLKTYLADQLGAFAAVDLKAAMERHLAAVARRQAQTEWVLLAAGIAVALIGLLALVAARRPLRRLAASTRSYVASDLSFQTLSMRNDEAAELQAAIRTLVDRLDTLPAKTPERSGDIDGLSAVQEAKQTAFTHAAVAMLVIDAQAKVIAANGALLKACARGTEEIVGQSVNALWSEEHHDAKATQAMCAFLEQQGHWQGQVWLRRSEAAARPMWASATAVREDEAHGERAVIALIDSSHAAPGRRSAEEELAIGLDEQLAHALARTRRQGSSAALLQIEVDQFKGVDEILGAQDSEQLMQAAMDRLYAGLRVQDLVMRTAADRFVVLLQDVREAEQVRRVAEKILGEFSLPVEMGSGLELPLRAHVGIALAPQDADAADRLKAAAADAAARARELRGAGYAFFSTATNDQMLQRHAIENALRDPEVFAQLSLRYEPRVYVDNGRLVGARAAPCWQHPEHGLLSVDRFLSLAPPDTARAIEDWSLREACRQIAAWRQSGLAPIVVAIGMQRASLDVDHLIELVESTLSEARIDARFLELEWNVALLPPAEEIGRAFDRFAQLGVGLTLDIDAADRVALSRARRLPLTRVKLGRALVESIRSNPLDQAMARATITLARSLGAEIVVQDVETASQADFLRAEGCLVLQGPLYGAPQSAQALQPQMAMSARSPRDTMPNPT